MLEERFRQKKDDRLSHPLLHRFPGALFSFELEQSYCSQSDAHMDPISYLSPTLFCPVCGANKQKRQQKTTTKAKMEKIVIFK
jgi:hypothetical protein